MFDSFTQLPELLQVLIAYLLVINLVAFFIYGLDKAKSYGTGRRISEKSLWLIALLGGSIGALLAMKLFRHKTKKISFQLILVLIVALQVALTMLFVNSVY